MRSVIEKSHAEKDAMESEITQLKTELQVNQKVYIHPSQKIF